MSLRLFAVGAVVQHFPLTLARQPGSDFRLPTDEELDALEAFQLSLGRQEDLNLDQITPKGDLLAWGKSFFFNEEKCNLCHTNAGANVSFRDQPENRNFNTGVELLPDQPADLIDAANNPPDGGFGRAPHPTAGFGNGTFNTPTVVEAADTGPFFHNHAVTTIEGAVDFYNSEAFNSSPAGQFIGGVSLEPTQVEAVAAFLRILNVAENIRSAEVNERRALARIEQDHCDGEQVNSAGLRLLNIAVAELQDAIAVLQGGALHPNAVALLNEAVKLDRKAMNACSKAEITRLIRASLAKQRAARDRVIDLENDPAVELQVRSKVAA